MLEEEHEEYKEQERKKMRRRQEEKALKEMQANMKVIFGKGIRNYIHYKKLRKWIFLGALSHEATFTGNPEATNCNACYRTTLKIMSYGPQEKCEHSM